MTTEARLARVELGLIMRTLRQSYLLRTENKKNYLSRKRLADKVGVNKQLIIFIEHGNSNPKRQDFEKVISCLKIPECELDEVYRLLNIFSSPRRWKQRGYRAPFVRLSKKRQSLQKH